MKFFSNLPAFFRKVYNRVTASIAFYPSLIATGFFLFTGAMILFEKEGITAEVEKFLPFLIIKDPNVAGTILNTLIGALISLTVFSFSMVMVMLNNASANFSPRVLPELISDKNNQTVLGVYLGTIIYCIFLTINIAPSHEELPVPSIGVLVGILFGIICLIFFVFFIHSISRAVQVNYILENLYRGTRENMEDGAVSKLGEEPIPDDLEFKHKISHSLSGYLESVDNAMLHEICEDLDLHCQLLYAEGSFVVEQTPIFQLTKKIEEEDEERFISTLTFSVNERVEKEHILGFKHITEIAVKAMSPGINDPGTAVVAIDYLTILFSKKMTLPETGAIKIIDDDNDKETEEETFKPVRAWLKMVGFQDLIYYIIASLRQYSKSDLIVMSKILLMLKCLLITATELGNKKQQKVLQAQINILLEDAEGNLKNSGDLERFKGLAK